MSIYDIGIVCKKTMGREKDKYCAVVDIIDKNYLLIDGLSVKRRRVSKNHIEIEDEKKPEYIKIKKGATHDKVVAAITKAKLEKKLSS